MNKQFWAASLLFLSVFLLTSCQSTALRGELSQDYYNIGNAYFDLKKYDKAAVYYKKALYLDSSLNQATFNLARTSLEIQEYKEAIKLLNDLVIKDEQNLLILEMLGYAWYQMGDTEKAVEYYLKCLSIDSAHSRSLYNLGILEKQNSNWNLSRQYLERLLLLEDKKEYRMLLAELTVAEGDKESAIMIYEDLITDYEGDIKAYKVMKDLYIDLEDYSKALDMLDALIDEETDKTLIKEYYFEKCYTEILILDDVILGQSDLLSALRAGYSDREKLDELLNNVDPLFKTDLEKIIKENLTENDKKAADILSDTVNEENTSLNANDKEVLKKE